MAKTKRVLSFKLQHFKELMRIPEYKNLMVARSKKSRKATKRVNKGMTSKAKTYKTFIAGRKAQAAANGMKSKHKGYAYAVHGKRKQGMTQPEFDAFKKQGLDALKAHRKKIEAAKDDANVPMSKAISKLTLSTRAKYRVAKAIKADKKKKTTKKKKKTAKKKKKKSTKKVPCKSNQLRSGVTGHCVNKSGPTGKKMTKCRLKGKVLKNGRCAAKSAAKKPKRKTTKKKAKRKTTKKKAVRRKSSRKKKPVRRYGKKN